MSNKQYRRLWSQQISDEAAELYFYTKGTYLHIAPQKYELKAFVEARRAVEAAERQYIKDHCRPDDCPFQIEDKVDVAYRIYKEAIADA